MIINGNKTSQRPILRLYHMIGFLGHCPRQLRELAFFILLGSRMEYSAELWYPYLSKRQLNVKPRNLWTDMINILGWDTIGSQLEKYRLKYLNNVIGSRVTVPHEGYITSNNSRTRSVNSKIYKHYSAMTWFSKILSSHA